MRRRIYYNRLASQNYAFFFFFFVFYFLSHKHEAGQKVGHLSH